MVFVKAFFGATFQNIFHVGLDVKRSVVEVLPAANLSGGKPQFPLHVIKFGGV